MSESKELAPHIDDIDRAVNGKLSEEKIEEELQTYTETYGVPLGSAKRSITRKYDGDPEKLYQGSEKKIEDIGGDEHNLDLKARVVSVDEKEIEVDNEPKDIFYGILGDETGTIPFTLWEPKDMELEEGKTIEVRNAYTNTWNDKPQINMNSKTSLDECEEPDDHLKDTQPVELKNLRPDMKNLRTVVRILKIEEKEIKTGKELYTGVMADQTGKAKFSAFHDFGIEAGNVVEIEGGRVKTRQGIPQFTFDEDAEVEFGEDDSLPPKEELDEPVFNTISDFAKRGGAMDAVVDAVMIDVKSGSGLVFRCPKCDRVLEKSNCRVHGSVDGEADLRVKGILDDGTGALTVIANRELMEDFLGYDLEEAIQIAKEKMNRNVIKDEIEEKLIAQPVRVRGKITSDDYGLMLTAEDLRKKSVSS